MESLSRHLSLRKRIRKQAERKYPGRTCAWFGGILYFTDQIPRNGIPEEVPGTERVPKPGAKTIGYHGAQISPPIQVPSEKTGYEEEWLPRARYQW